MSERKLNLKGILNSDEREALANMLADNRDGSKALAVFIEKLVADRGQAVLLEQDMGKLLAKRSEYDGARKLAKELTDLLTVPATMIR